MKLTTLLALILVALFVFTSGCQFYERDRHYPSTWDLSIDPYDGEPAVLDPNLATKVLGKTVSIESEEMVKIWVSDAVRKAGGDVLRDGGGQILIIVRIDDCSTGDIYRRAVASITFYARDESKGQIIIGAGEGSEPYSGAVECNRNRAFRLATDGALKDAR